jgi:hypothetical protein
MMTIIPEAVLAITALCNAPCRKRQEQRIHYIASSGMSASGFAISSGPSLEEELTMEIKDIVGVSDVSIEPAGEEIQVNVVLREMVFEVFDKVVQKEIELFDRFPEKRFHVSITSEQELRSNIPSVHAA